MPIPDWIIGPGILIAVGILIGWFGHAWLGGRGQHGDRRLGRRAGGHRAGERDD